MYQAVLLLLYLLVFIPALTHLVRYRDDPGSRRVSVGLGIVGALIAPTAAAFICELLASIFGIGLFLVIFIVGLKMMLKSIFH